MQAGQPEEADVGLGQDELKSGKEAGEEDVDTGQVLAEQRRRVEHNLGQHLSTTELQRVCGGGGGVDMSTMYMNM